MGARSWLMQCLASLAVVALLVVIVVFSVVGAIVGMARGFGEGFRRQPPAPAPREPAPDTTSSRPASAADVATSAKNLAANVRKPTAADVEKGARALGRAIGAAKRAARSEPDE